jgi:hypothetical protein
MMLGFVLFILPGLVLLAGWSAASAFIVAEDRGGAGALGASWRATAPVRVSLSFLVLGYILVLLGGGVSVFFLPASLGGGQVTEVVLTDILTAAGSVLGWLFAAAIYRLAVPAEGALEHVFA